MAYIGKQQDANKKTVFPVTVAKAVLVESEGKSVEECIQELSSYKGDAIAAKEAAVAAKTEAEEARDAALAAKEAAITARDAAGEAAETYGTQAGEAAASAKIDEALGDGGVIKEALDNATDRLAESEQLLSKVAGVSDVQEFKQGQTYGANTLVSHNDNGVVNIYRVMKYVNDATWTYDESVFKKTSVIKEVIDIRTVNVEVLCVHLNSIFDVDLTTATLVVRYSGNTETYTFDKSGNSEEVPMLSGIRYDIQVQMPGDSDFKNSAIYTYVSANTRRDVNITVAKSENNVEKLFYTATLASPAGILKATYENVYMVISDITAGSSNTYRATKGSSNAQAKLEANIPLGHTYTISLGVDSVVVNEDGVDVEYRYTLPNIAKYIATYTRRDISRAITQIDNEVFECAYEDSDAEGNKYLRIIELSAVKDKEDAVEGDITWDDVKFIHVNPKVLTEVTKDVSTTPAGDISFWFRVDKKQLMQMQLSTVNSANTTGGASISWNVSSITTNKKNLGFGDGHYATQQILKLGVASAGINYINESSVILPYVNITYNRPFVMSAYQQIVWRQLANSVNGALYNYLAKKGITFDLSVTEHHSTGNGSTSYQNIAGSTSIVFGASRMTYSQYVNYGAYSFKIQD